MKKILMSIIITLVILLSGCRSASSKVDTTAPRITINPYEEEFYIEGVTPLISATCIDDVDETCLVTTPNYPDLNVHGVHIVTFRATDSNGNVATETITINAIDRAEFITLTIGPYSTTVELGDLYVFPTVTCASSKSSNCVVDVPINLNTDTVNPALTYIVTGSDDQENSRTFAITVEVVDTTNPTITLTGDAAVSVELGGTWTDPGVTTDDLQTVIVTQDVTPDFNTVGVYPIIYTATDASGNIATTTRTVTVEDTTNPTITLNGDATYNLTTVEGASWIDPGVTTSDLQTVIVTQDITPDYSIAGTYVVTYTATDASGNFATVTRTINVT